MDLRAISKAIAGAAATGVVSLGTYIAIPPEAAATMPWWGYVGVGVLNAVIGFGVVYLAPRNQ